MIAAAEVLDSSFNLPALAAALVASEVVLTVAAVGRAFFDVAGDDLRDLDYFSRQLRLDTVEDSTVDVETADSVGGIDRAFDFDAAPWAALGSNELPTVPAVGSDLGAEDLGVHIEDDGFVELQLFLPEIGEMLLLHRGTLWSFFIPVHCADGIHRPVNGARVIAVFGLQFVFEELGHGASRRKTWTSDPSRVSTGGRRDDRRGNSGVSESVNYPREWRESSPSAREYRRTGERAAPVAAGLSSLV